MSQIVTFGTMSSKAVIRDVGRVFGLPYSLCDRISKLIPIVQNKPVSLAEALEQEPALKELMADERDGESVRELFDLAARLEDLTRNVGMHAGGVLDRAGQDHRFLPDLSGHRFAMPRRSRSSTRTTSRRPVWSSSTSSACAT